MYLGMLIGLMIFGFIMAKIHNVQITPERNQMISNTDPKVLSSVRINGTARLIGVFCFLIGACGAVGWIIEVLS